MTDTGQEEPSRYHFDDLALDTGQRLVTRGDQSLDISGLTFDLLQAIVEAAPNIISADELAEKVWSGRPTSPETITQRAMMLRQALGDNAESPKYFEVVRGRGFRLIPALEVPKEREKVAQSTPRSRIPMTVAAVVAGAAIFYAGLQFNGQESQISSDERPQIRRTETDLGVLNTLGPSGTSVELALSPDGTQLAYVINSPGVGNTLYLRSLDDFEAKPMVEVVDGRHPYFSENSEWLFFEPDASTLSKVPIYGGSPVEITSGGHTRIYGSTRARNGDIIFSTNSDNNNFQSGRLVRVPSGGGDPSVVLEPPVGISFTWPHMLPDGNSVLFTSRSSTTPATQGNVSVLSMDSGKHSVLLNGAYNARYSPTGHLLFGRDGNLWAIPFDIETLEITGDGQPVLHDVHGQRRLGQLVYDFSSDGHLVYARGGDASGVGRGLTEMVWVDESGSEERVNLEPLPVYGPKISPDGSKIAVLVSDELGGWDIWVQDLQRETTSKLTFDSANDSGPIWSPDGKEIWFESHRESGVIHSKAADGTGEVTALWKDTSLSNLEAISPDGQYFVLADTGQGESDMYLLDRNSGEPPKPLIVTPLDEGSADISPDGRFIAYASDETGRQEIYVRPFPDVEGGKWQISSTGANEPQWSADGNRLYFRHQNLGRISVVDVISEPVFHNSKPRIVYSGNIVGSGWPRYGISPVDNRLLVIRNVNSVPGTDQVRSGSVSLAFVENWFEELKRITPTEQ